MLQYSCTFMYLLRCWGQFDLHRDKYTHTHTCTQAHTKSTSVPCYNPGTQKPSAPWFFPPPQCKHQHHVIKHPRHPNAAPLHRGGGTQQINNFSWFMAQAIWSTIVHQQHEQKVRCSEGRRAHFNRRRKQSGKRNTGIMWKETIRANLNTSLTQSTHHHHHRHHHSWRVNPMLGCWHAEDGTRARTNGCDSRYYVMIWAADFRLCPENVWWMDASIKFSFSLIGVTKVFVQ